MVAVGHTVHDVDKYLVRDRGTSTDKDIKNNKRVSISIDGI